MRWSTILTALSGVLVALTVLVVTTQHSLDAPSGASAVEATIRVRAVTTRVGEQGTVNLQAIGMPPPGLGGWSIDIGYASDIVSVESCTPFLRGICNPQFAPNTIRTVGAPDPGLPGDFTIAAIVFECQREGISSLTIVLNLVTDATFLDPQPINSATQDGVVICAGVSQPPPTQLVAVPGDVSCDGAVNAIDATLILQFHAGLLSSMPCAASADINLDGSIDPLDVTLILQFDAGRIGSLPPPSHTPTPGPTSTPRPTLTPTPRPTLFPAEAIAIAYEWMQNDPPFPYSAFRVDRSSCNARWTGSHWRVVCEGRSIAQGCVIDCTTDGLAVCVFEQTRIVVPDLPDDPDC